MQSSELRDQLRNVPGFNEWDQAFSELNEARSDVPRHGIDPMDESHLISQLRFVRALQDEEAEAAHFKVCLADASSTQISLVGKLSLLATLDFRENFRETLVRPPFKPARSGPPRFIKYGPDPDENAFYAPLEHAATVTNAVEEVRSHIQSDDSVTVLVVKEERKHFLDLESIPILGVIPIGKPAYELQEPLVEETAKGFSVHYELPTTLKHVHDLSIGDDGSESVRRALWFNDELRPFLRQIGQEGVFDLVFEPPVSAIRKLLGQNNHRMELTLGREAISKALSAVNGENDTMATRRQARAGHRRRRRRAGL